MFFLLRMAFWLCVVCVLLPAFGGSKSAPEAQINAGEAVTLATAAVSDARGFCERQPEACAVGGKVAVAIGYKAEAGARTIYEFISDKLTEKPAAPEKAADKATAKFTPASTAARGTLTAEDLAPSWHAPVPLPPRREARAGRPSV